MIELEPDLKAGALLQHFRDTIQLRLLGRSVSTRRRPKRDVRHLQKLEMSLGKVKDRW